MPGKESRTVSARLELDDIEIVRAAALLDGTETVGQWIRDTIMSAALEKLQNVEEEQLTRKLDKIENEFRARRVEHAAVFDRGTAEIVLKKTSNEPNYVSFTPREALLMKDRILTHNHPTSGAFSREDIFLAAETDLAEIRVSSVRADYRFRRPPGGWPPEFAEWMQEVVPGIEQQIYGEIAPLVNSGRIPLGEANFIHWHEVWTRFVRAASRKYGPDHGIVYERWLVEASE